ncbi:AraC family transcriptional regulator [Maribacter halichondriae]|uniref:AraC family transcriptional regulator n=1 Tax=Maribacter halichondriae TaxID=2980554 RepID=UPI002359015D|nr:AraC family transcriptional regulator [Maribacter sp. Hal144]
MLLDILIFTGILFSFLTAFLIWFRFTPTTFNTHLIASYLFLNALCTSFYLLIVYGIINYFPFLYKIPAPISFLIPPISYIYVRAVLYNQHRFKKVDFVHLIPFMFFTINYLPFYMMDMAEKSRLVLKVTQDFELTYIIQNGLLPEWVNIVARSSLAFLYIGLQWKLIYSFFKKHRKANSKQFNAVKKWVYDLSIMQTLYLFALLVVYMANAFLVVYSTPIDDFIRISAGFLVGATLLCISGYLLWNPKLLMGMPNLAIRDNEVSKPPREIPSGFDFEALHQYLEEHHLFLNADLKIHLLSETVGISARKISYVIGESEYNNFNDYINHLRIDYATSRIQNDYLTHYSVEALSEVSGFNSKNAFYRAFKKVHGLTPGQYQSKK